MIIGISHHGIKSVSCLWQPALLAKVRQDAGVISVTVLAVPWMSGVPEYMKMAIGMAVVEPGPPRCWLASLKRGLLQVSC